jgi:hypothetical protein
VFRCTWNQAFPEQSHAPEEVEVDAGMRRSGRMQMLQVEQVSVDLDQQATILNVQQKAGARGGDRT